MTGIQLSILIPTLKSREKYFLALARNLCWQAAGKQVEILALQNNGTHTLAEYREKLLREARGQYVVFIDDDDLVRSEYVSYILNALETNPHVVVFPQFCTGTACPVTLFGMGYDGAPWDPVLADGLPAYVRAYSHVLPVRREIAGKSTFINPAMPSGYTQEDQVFVAGVVEQLRALGQDLREERIQVPLYCYMFNATGTSTQTGRPKEADEPMPLIRPVVGSPNFHWVFMGGKGELCDGDDGVTGCRISRGSARAHRSLRT